MARSILGTFLGTLSSRINVKTLLSSRWHGFWRIIPDVYPLDSQGLMAVSEIAVLTLAIIDHYRKHPSQPSGRRGRWFKSSRPDSNNPLIIKGLFLCHRRGGILPYPVLGTFWEHCASRDAVRR